MKKMSETETYYALLWYLKKTEYRFTLPTYEHVDREFMDDDGLYGYQVVGPERVKVREYSSCRCVWADVYDYADITSMRI